MTLIQDQGSVLDQSILLRKQAWDVVLLFVFALTARLVYFYFSSLTHSLETVAVLSPDHRVFRLVADYISTGAPEIADKIFQVGPGYGLILWLMRFFFENEPLAAAGLNILLGSLGSVLLYLLAWVLFESRPVALMTGMINAISSMSLAMSVSMLSDQPFFTFQAASIVCFALALKTDRTQYYILAGLIASFALLVRSLTQFWPILLIAVPLALPRSVLPAGKWHTVKRAAIPAAIMLVTILGWSARNYSDQGVFTFGSNGVKAARWYLSVKALAINTEGEDMRAITSAWLTADSAYFNYQKSTPGQDYRRCVDQMFELIDRHPDYLFTTFVSTAYDNALNGNHFPALHMPQHKGFWNLIAKFSAHWLNKALAILTLIAVGWLGRSGNWMPAILLGMAWFYFSAITGFTFWQGARLHFPAEMAWAPLVSWVIYQVGKRPVRKIRMRFTMGSR